MKNTVIIFLFFLSFSTITSCQTKFDREIWIKNNSLYKKKNPRFYMIDDLLENHLKVGMSKNSIIHLLGEPNKDTIELYIPKGIKLPDSLKFKNKQLLIVKDDRINYINEWYHKNYKSARFLSYPVGWSLIDPLTLKIMLDEKYKIVDFWIKEH